MKTKGWLVVAAPVWGFIASLTFGSLHPGYSHISQHISELAAVDAPYNLWMSYMGLLPYGIFLFLGSLFFIKTASPATLPAYGFLLMSACFFILVALFPCEYGCPWKRIPLTAHIHNISAHGAFLSGLCAQLFLGSLFSEHRDDNYYGYCLLIGLVSVPLYILMNMSTIPYGTNFWIDYRGLIQRVFLANYSLWLLLTVLMHPQDREKRDSRDIIPI